MKCPVCWQNVELRRDGVYPRHRIELKDKFTFCPMSGEPYTPQNAEAQVG